jgi:WD40 repeat protein
MGVVYKARQTRADRLVALKMILAGAHASLDELERFRTEAQASARLQHPNIVQIHEVSEHEGSPFFSLEFCAAGSLEKRLDGTPWQARGAAQLVETLARAMDAAHRQNIIHRDLKPANILLAADETPKITDFGLAKKLDEDGATRPGSVMGTPSYMAPEQANGSGKAGPAADVYALGAILYQLLTGRPPFKAATPWETVRQVLSEDPVSPIRLNGQTPLDLETICLKCLHKDPARRYESAQALAEDLRRFQAGEPIVARPVGRLERAIKWVKRRPGVAALLATIILVTILGFAGITWKYLEAEVQRQFAEEQQQKAEAEERAKAKALDGEKQAHQAAEEEKRKAVENSIRLMLTTGQRYLNDGDLFVAMLYAVEAWSAEDMESPRNRIHQHRLATLLQQAPKLLHVYAHPKGVTHVEFSPDGRRFLTASQDHTAQVWDAGTGKVIGPPLAHQAPVNHAAFSPDGRRVITGSDDRTATVWDAETGQQLLRFQLERAALHVGFSPPDGRYVLVVSGTRFERTVSRTVQLPPRTQQIPAGVGPGGMPRWITQPVPGGSTTTQDRPEGIAQVWDVNTGKPVGTEIATDGWMNHASFSKDGRRIVTAGGSEEGDNEVQVWTLATPAEQALRRQVQIGRLLGSAPLGPLAVIPWLHPRWQSYEDIGPLELASHVHEAWFSPDSSRLVTASGQLEDNKGEARIWDAFSGKPLGQPLRHGRVVTCARFSPDGRRVLTASHDQTARIWDVNTGDPVTPPLKHQDVLAGGWFSPDGRRVLTASWDGSARVWDANSGEPLSPLLRHGSPLTCAAFAPDSRRVLTADRDGQVRLWDLVTDAHGPAYCNHQMVVQPSQAGVTRTVHFNQDDDDERLSRSRTELGDVVVTAAVFSADGRQILTGVGGRVLDVVPGGGSSRGTIEAVTRHVCRWDASTGEVLQPPLQHSVPWTAAFLSPDGQRLVTLKGSMFGGAGGSACLWELGTGKLLVERRVAAGAAARAVSWSSDGRCRLATTTGNKVAVHWLDPATDGLIFPPLEHEAPVECVAFSPDGNMLVTLSVRQTVARKKAPAFTTLTRVWDMRNAGRLVGSPLSSPRLLTQLAVNRDGSQIITYAPRRSDLASIAFALPDPDQAAEAQLWHVGGGTFHTLKHSGVLLHAGFSPDGRYVVTTSADRSAQVWEAATGRRVTPPLEHRAAVNHACFGPDGLLATASNDRSARLWDLATGEPVGPPLLHRDWVLHVNFSPDGRRLVTAGCDGVARVWDLGLGERTRDQVRRLAEVLAGARLDGSHGLTVLDPATLSGNLEKLRSARPAVCVPGTALLAAWHRQQAEEAEKVEDWFGALPHLAYLIHSAPGQWRLHIRRACALMRRLEAEVQIKGTKP